MARLGAGFLTRKPRADRICTPHAHACPEGTILSGDNSHAFESKHRLRAPERVIVRCHRGLWRRGRTIVHLCACCAKLASRMEHRRRGGRREKVVDPLWRSFRSLRMHAKTAGEVAQA